MSEEEFMNSLNRLIFELKEYYESKGLSGKIVASLPDNQKKILANAFIREKREGRNLTKKQVNLIKRLKEGHS